MAKLTNAQLIADNAALREAQQGLQQRIHELEQRIENAKRAYTELRDSKAAARTAHPSRRPAYVAPQSPERIASHEEFKRACAAARERAMQSGASVKLGD